MNDERGCEVKLFVCRADNYGCLIHDPETGVTAAIDAPEADPVLAAAAEAGWTLTHILVTHHHGDHVDGIAKIKAATGAKVVANAADAHRVPLVDQTVKPGARFAVGSVEIDVIDTPGHTVGHVAYHLAEEGLLFAGDTLFALGCGRLFEGSAADMWGSLERLAALPDETEVYCGHEYTLANARFAVTVDPQNAALAARVAEIEALRTAGLPTLPTTIRLEKATNPFLRAGDASVAAMVGMSGAAPGAVFAELRDRKNRF